MSRKPVEEGGCQCGKVRYALYQPPRRAGICHCRMCQKATGNYFAPLANVEIGDFEVTKGKMATFASSTIATRGFCRDCGTPLTFSYTEMPSISVMMGSMDNPDCIAPSQQFGQESRRIHLDTAVANEAHVIEDLMPEEMAAKLKSHQK